MIPRYAPIVAQNMLGITPKSPNAVDMVLGLFIYELFRVGVLKDEMQHRWSNGIGGDEWARGTVS